MTLRVFGWNRKFAWFGTMLLCILLLFMMSGCATGVRPPRWTRAVDRVMDTTGYCKCGKCCNWKRNWRGKRVVASGPNKGKAKKVGYTASGVKAKAHRTIAADTSVYPFGTVMYVPGWGCGRVEDRGGSIKGSRIDLFFGSHKKAVRWGRRKVKVRVWLPK